MASGDVHAKDLMDMQMLTTVEGKNVTVRVAGKDILINSAKVTAADNDASNGVVHIIDSVLMPGDAPTPASKTTIVDLAVATPDLSTLVTALKAAGLVDTLSGTGPFTVFAPTNEAFAKLPAGVLANLLKPENKAQLVDILTYHVVAGKAVHKTDIPTGSSDDLTSVEGKTVDVVRVCGDRKCKRTHLRINPTSSGRYIARVSSPDNDASNGVVHIVDTVLTLAPNTIADLAANNDDLSTLVTALKAADLVDTLSGTGPFTVFAPSNAAFAALPAGTLADLLKPENKAQLVDILTYHVSPHDVHASQIVDGELIDTVEGKKLNARVSTGPPAQVFINNGKVTSADNNATNGVVHIIDSVLLPGSAPGPNNKTDHLWFRGVSCSEFSSDFCRCGEVDAAPRMPQSLFDPKNAAALKRYELITTMFYKYATDLGTLEVGRCKDIGYIGTKGGEQGVTWTAGAKLMGPICESQCHCSFGTAGNSSFPYCKDQPDDPSVGKWCSLCGPKYNQVMTVVCSVNSYHDV